MCPNCLPCLTGKLPLMQIVLAWLLHCLATNYERFSVNVYICWTEYITLKVLRKLIRYHVCLVVTYNKDTGKAHRFSKSATQHKPLPSWGIIIPKYFVSVTTLIIRRIYENGRLDFDIKTGYLEEVKPPYNIGYISICFECEMSETRSVGGPLGTDF